MSRSLRLFTFILLLTLAVPATLGLYRVYAEASLEQELQRYERDPETGVRLGQGARTLAPLEPNGEAVLLIHGFGGGPQDFNDLGEHLAQQGLTVRLLRLPGYGTDPIDMAQQAPETLMDAVRDEYRQLALDHDRVHVIGFSLGGALATRLAAEQPIERLVLIGPYYSVQQRWYYLLPVRTWHRLLRPHLEYVVKWPLFTNVNDRSAVDTFMGYRVIPASAIDAATVIGDVASSDETLKRIRSKVLLLHPMGDLASDPRRSREILGRMDNAASRRALDYPNSNHILLWDHDRDAAKQDISDFLTR